MAARIGVVGSLVMDLVLQLPRFPRKHETLLAQGFGIFPGGKGLNQALAARRCGAEVLMVGRVGQDAFGDDFLRLLAEEGVDARVSRDPGGTSLGIPLIVEGENAIIGVPRANTTLAVQEVEAVASELAAADLLLLQNEVPLECSLAAARAARRVLLNPAPADPGLHALLGEVDWLLPNEVEAQMLSGEEHPLEAAKRLLERVREGVVVTLGERGALCLTRQGLLTQAAFPAHAVDPTGAGDAFCGAFGVALAEGRPLDQALRFATAAGSICVTSLGAAPSLAKREAIEALQKNS